MEILFRTLKERPYRLVEQGQWCTGRGVFVARKIGAAVALAAHNSVTKKGLLGCFWDVSDELIPEWRQFPDDFQDQESFRQSLQHLQSLGPVAQTSVWVGGAGREYDGMIDSRTDGKRLYVVRRIGALILSENRVATNWIDTPNHLMSVQLHCSSGELTAYCEQTKQDNRPQNAGE